ncbi:MAG: hypothetical protein R8G66_09910 [Cytophagales bacterium]|nr:hypothetical protein [Cytophagales bacterium]
MRTNKIWIPILVMGLMRATLGWSQIEDIAVSEEVTIDRLYIGFLAESRIHTKSLNQSRNLTFQSGARISLTVIPGVMKVRSFGVLREIGDDDPKPFTNFESIITPGKRWAIHLGLMATPTTELRPNPSTWQSQVETNAERTIPGGRPGVKVNYQFSKEWKIGMGLHQQDGAPAYHLKLGYNMLSVSGFIRNNELFVAARRVDEKTEFVASFDENHMAFSAIVHAFEDLSFYADLEVDTGSIDRVVSKLGIRRYYQGQHALRGFFSLSYDRVLHRVEGGFFIHI